LERAPVRLMQSSWLPTGNTWLKIGVLIDPLGAAVLVLRCHGRS
jgi:hypothetical protein